MDFWFFQNCKIFLRKITLQASSGRGMHLANMALEDKVRKMCENVDRQTERRIFWRQKTGASFAVPHSANAYHEVLILGGKLNT